MGVSKQSEMRLKYCPLKDMNTYSCREYGVVSILNTCLGEYGMVNKNALALEWKQNGEDRFAAEKGRIRIDAGMNGLAEQYYGISFSSHWQGDADLSELLEEEIGSGRLCMISMDLFWNDYKPDHYKKSHTPLHDQTVAGWAGDRYICYTWFHEYTLAKEDVEEGTQCLTVYAEKQASLRIDRQLLAEGAAEVCRMEKSTESILEGIVRAFENTPVEEIYSSVEELTQADLFMNLRIMARSRQRFSAYWAYLLGKLQGQLGKGEMRNYRRIEEAYREAADIWWKMNILLKYEYIYRQGNEIGNRDIMNKLLDNIKIADKIEKKARAYCKVFRF